jgi:hypothetical protein
MRTHLSGTLGLTLCASLAAIGACGSGTPEDEAATHADERSANGPSDFTLQRDPQGGYLVAEGGAGPETHVRALDMEHASLDAARAIAHEGTPDGLLLYGSLDSGDPDGGPTFVVLALGGHTQRLTTAPQWTVNPAEVDVSIPAPWHPGGPPEGALDP